MVLINMLMGVIVLNKMLLIDLETQNYPVESGIYEAACLVVEDYEVVDQLYLGKEIEGHIGDKRYGYGFYDISRDDECLTEFKEFLSKYPYPIVAHNCAFDKKFLLYYSWVEESYSFYCSMRAIRIAQNSLESYALHNLVRYYQIADDTDHKAMSDTINLYKLLKIIQPKTWIPVGTPLQKKSNRSGWGKKIKPRSLDEIDLPIYSTDILAGENVCFTGKSEYPRHTMEEIAIKNGAEISNNVISKTTLLVVGLDAGSKLDKAQAKEIVIISDKEFMKMLDLAGKDVGA